MDSKRRKLGDEDISAVRQKSRFAYLAQRESQQLALLRRQVAEEAEEEDRLGDKLSEKERREFVKNRETLRLAEARNAIDEHFDGYSLPDSNSKSSVLNRRHGEKEKDNRSEYQLWEEEQSKKVSAQIRKPAVVNENDYEFVFDEASQISFKAMAQAQVDPEQQRLLATLDEAEKKAKTIQDVRASLPIAAFKDELIAAMKSEQILIVTAETGSGKSTQLASYAVEAGFAAEGKRVVCTQPRRVAAMSLAKRVAEENNTRLGKRVGYSVRFESKLDENETQVEFVTDGILLRALAGDILLSKYSVVILDEAHERSVNTDLLISLTKEICAVRPEFRLIISSASLNAQRFSEYYGHAGIFAVPGRTFPIQNNFTTSPEANYLNAAVTCIFQCHLALQGEEGDILVFLAGQDEIEAAVQYCEDTLKKLGNRVAPLTVLPLYGSLPIDEQQRIFQPTEKGVRKCIVSTNIAETSLTIDGVTVVIDAGMEKQLSYDARSGMSTLSVVPISRASAAQRSGRAGRTRPGKCFRLYTAWSYANELLEQHPPEIQRCNFDSVALNLLSLGIRDLVNFDFMDPPPVTTIAKSLENLYSYGFVTSSGCISKLGRRASELPLDPQLAKTLLAAEQYGCASEVITIVAMVAEAGALFFAPKDKKLAADHAKARFFQASEGGDLLGLLRLYLEFEENEFSPIWSRENFVQHRSITRVRDVREQLLNLCDKVEIPRSSCGVGDHVSIMKALTAGFFHNVARLQRDGQTYAVIGKSGLSVRIHPSSCVSKTQPKWVIFHELISTSTEFIRSVAPIDPNWLLEVAPHLYKPSDLEKLGVDKKMGKGPGKVGTDR
jgi:pre-mRNA-splicing factor ATP-dependent RNA helicase DHX16